MKKTTISIVVAALCLIFSAEAQIPKTSLPKNQAILGKVISASTGEALPGAVIKVTSNKQTVLSNDKGEFIFSLANGVYNLSVHYLSYKTKSLNIQVPLADSLIIKLEVDDTNLNEVEINAGYYTVKDKERTGSISRITSETIARQPVSNPLLAMQATMPGIYIQQTSGIPGSNINVRIRGRNSIDAGNNPFYIIDGVPFSSQAMTSSFSSDVLYGLAGASPFNSINPNDIESIEVLKDADATAIYGSRGANGVVLITTKKGKAGKTQVDFNVLSGFSKVSRKMKMFNTDQFLAMRREAFSNDGTTPGAADYDINGTWDQTRNTDWQKELIGGTAGFTNAQLSVSGGNEHTRFLLSGSFNSQTTVMPGDFGYNRYATHFSASHTGLNGKLKIDFSTILSADRNHLFDQDLTFNAIVLAPNAPALYNEDGSLNWEKSTWINPLSETRKDFLANGLNLSNNAIIIYRLLKGFTVKANLGFTDNRMNDRKIEPSSFYDPALNKTPANAISDFNNTRAQSWIAEPQLNWDAKFGFGKLSFLVGLTFQAQGRDQQALRGTGFPSDDLMQNLQAASVITVRDYSNTEYRYNAVFGRVNYIRKEKYILNLTGRRDGSSRFGPGKQFANFGAVGAAWLFSKEKWMERFSFLSLGKLRASYGLSGNDQIGDYEFLDVYKSGNPYNGITGLNPLRLFNPDFAWEVNKKFELGLDVAFFNDRIRLTTGYYKNTSSNQLVKYPLALTTGFSSVRNNMAATVRNTGFELELNTVNIRNKQLSWSSSFNLTVPYNKLVAFPGLAASSYANTYVVGMPLNIRKLYKTTGINPQTGLWGFVDVNGDQIINSNGDQQFVEVIGQQFYGGFNNEISYKNLQLSVLFQFVKQRSGNFASSYGAYPGINNQPLAYLNKQWQKPGDAASVQKLTSGANTEATSAYSKYTESTGVVDDTSFIRLKNVQLAYTANKLFSGNNSVKLFMQGQNLFMITKYFGLDPEMGGITMPGLRTVTFGANLNF